MTPEGQEVTLRGHGKACGPMSERQCPEDCFIGDAVELNHTLQTIASVDDNVRVTWTEPSKARREDAILTLRKDMRNH